MTSLREARVHRPKTLLTLIILVLCLTSFAAWAQPPANAPTHNLTPAEEKAMSEMNHRIAGGFLVAIGLLALAGNVSQRTKALRKVWPFLFILPGLLLLAFSDAEVWPMGPQSWWFVVQYNPQALQHKLFGFIMIGIGILELQRGRDRLKPFLATWGFPLIAVIGALLLFIHPHIARPVVAAAESTPVAAASAQQGHDMSAMDHSRHSTTPAEPAAKAEDHSHHEMEAHDHAATPAASPAATPPQAASASTHTEHSEHSGDAGHEDHAGHEKVKGEHLMFSLVGFGIALSKLFYDGRFWKGTLAAAAWPALMATLGILLILYAE